MCLGMSPMVGARKQERFVSTLMAECKIGPYRRGGGGDDFFERDSSEDRMHGMLEDVQQTVHKLVTQVNQQNQLSLEDQKAEICDSQQIEATASPLSAPVPEQVARNFLKALQAQYVQGTQNAVGDFFSSEGHEETLTKFEDEVRGAVEKTLFAFLKLLGTGPCFGDFKKEKLSPGVNLMDFSTKSAMRPGFLRRHSQSFWNWTFTHHSLEMPSHRLTPALAALWLLCISFTC